MYNNIKLKNVEKKDFILLGKKRMNNNPYRVDLFAKNLRYLRQSHGLSQEEIGKIMNLHRSAISYYESGKAFPKVDCTLLMCAFFDISIDEMFIRDLEDENI